MKHKVTIEDVAKYCHVSKSSVSRFLNHGYVSQEHKEKIGRAIQELGFERDYYASRLRAQCTRVIGVMVNANHGEDQEQILIGIRKHLKALQYQGSILFHTDDDEAECLRQLLAQGVDGVIALDSHAPGQLKEIVLTHHAKILFARTACDYAPYLVMDERMAGRILGRYFHERHYQRLIYLHHDDTLSEKRRTGFREAYGKEECALALRTIHDATEAYASMKELISGEYEAVICDRAHWALAGLRYAHEVHIHVPKNLAFACFGNEALCRYSYPSLTTVIYPNEAFGINLVEEIIAIHEGRSPRWETTSLALWEGESVGFCE